MEFSLKSIVTAILFSCVAALAQAPAYNVGRAPTPEELRAWDISVGPAGKELPPGSGTAKDGAPLYTKKCAACHGQNLEGGKAGPRLMGRPGDAHHRTRSKKHRELLAVRHHHLGLHQPGHAQGPGGHAQTR